MTAISTISRVDAELALAEGRLNRLAEDCTIKVLQEHWHVWEVDEFKVEFQGGNVLAVSARVLESGRPTWRLNRSRQASAE